MIEEFARYAGHGDILREQIDKATLRLPNRETSALPSTWSPEQVRFAKRQVGGDDDQAPSEH
jgi:Protein of unknown function (DUF664)